MRRHALTSVVALTIVASACGSSPPTIATATNCPELARAVFDVVEAAVERVDAMTPQQLAGDEGADVFDELLEPVRQARTQAGRLCGSEAAFDAELGPLLDDLEPRTLTGGMLVGVLRG